MKVKSGLHRALLSAFAFLGALFLATSPVRLGGRQNTDSQSQSDIRDLAAKKAALGNESNDLISMMEALQGPERDIASKLTEMAESGMMALDTTVVLLAVYDKMQCEQDRAIVEA